MAIDAVVERGQDVATAENRIGSDISYTRDDNNGSVTLSFSDEIITQLNTTQSAFLKVQNEFIKPVQPTNFFIALDTYNLIADNLLPKTYTVLKEALEHREDSSTWAPEQILSILGKSIIPDAIAQTLHNAQRIAADLAETESTNPRIREVGMGAGLATVMSYIEIKEALSKKGREEESVTIVSVDTSLGAIATTALVAQIHGIETRVIQGDKVPSDLLNFNGIILQLADATATLAQDAKSDERYNAAYSDHVISYFAPTIHDRTLDDMYDILLPGGVLSICGLEPDVEVSIAKIPLILAIIKAYGNDSDIKNMEERIRERTELAKQGALSPDEIHFEFQRNEETGQSYVKRYFTTQSAAIYSMLKYMWREDKSYVLKYLTTISKTTKEAKNLARTIDSPISRTFSILAGKILQNNADLLKSFETEVTTGIADAFIEGLFQFVPEKVFEALKGILPESTLEGNPIDNPGRDVMKSVYLHKPV